jgi:hypothetical protein
VNRVRPADVVAGIGGVVLLGSLWLKWYGIDPAAFADGTTPASPALAAKVPSIDAWQAFSVVDILLAPAALLAIGVPLTSAFARSPAKPVAFALLSTVGGALAVLLVLFRIVDQPGSNALVAVKAGAWIGLAGALITFVGSFLALADEHTPGAEPPPLSVRPAP